MFSTWNIFNHGSGFIVMASVIQTIRNTKCTAGNFLRSFVNYQDHNKNSTSWSYLRVLRNIWIFYFNELNIQCEDYFHFARNSVYSGRIFPNWKPNFNVYSEDGGSTFLRKLSGFVLYDVTSQNAVVFIDSSLGRPTSQCVKCCSLTGFPEPCLRVLQFY